MPQQFSSLTFGVEFELLVAVISDGQPNPNPDDPRQTIFPDTIIANYNELAAEQRIGPFYSLGPLAEAIALALRSHNIPAHPWFRAPKYTKNYLALPADLAGWLITYDGSIGEYNLGEILLSSPPERRPYDWLGIELVSPILTQHFNGSPPAANRDFEMIGEVLDIVKTEFMVKTNKSTGFHVHIGDGPNGFPIETSRKLMAFIWAFEPGIEKVHPPWRRGNNEWCPSLRTRLHRDLAGAPSQVVIREIMAQPDLQDLGRLVDRWFGRRGTEEGCGGTKFTSYNLTNMAGDPWEGKEKQTVEFRQHDATLEAEVAVRWARFCACLMRWVAAQTNEGVLRICTEEVERQERDMVSADLGEVCGIIGFEQGVEEWAGGRGLWGSDMGLESLYLEGGLSAESSSDLVVAEPSESEEQQEQGGNKGRKRARSEESGSSSPERRVKKTRA